MPRDLCSIIIPTYARPERLRAAVSSVLIQSDPHWELIVVCDGPQAEVQDALAPLVGDSRIRVVTQAHQGVSAARNHGIAHARGEWIAFLDDDDLWAPQKLAEQRRWMAHTGYLASQCDELWIRHGQRVNPMRKHIKPSGWIFPHCIDLCCISPSAIMLHRHVLDTIGHFNPHFPVCEDYELWLRLSLRYPVGRLPEPLVTKFGGHADQLSRQYHSMDAWRVKALELILENPYLHNKPAWRESAIANLIARCKILSHGAEKRGNREASDYFRMKYHRHEESYAPF